MSEHLTMQQVDSFRRGLLRGADVLAIGRHLDACAKCRLLAATAPEAEQQSRDVAMALAPDDEALCPPVDTELTAYVDGLARGPQRERIERHLVHCPRCRQDIDDLRSMRAALHGSRRFHPRFLAVAASVVVIVMTAAIWLAVRRTPAVVRPIPGPASTSVTSTYGRADWDALVRDALTAGSLALPAHELASVRETGDPLRGNAGPERTAMQPAGVIIETTRPHFVWTPVSGATYVVGVYAGERTAAESPRLDRAEWTTGRDLPRGVTCTWDVRVRRADGQESILPAPPSPSARFRIVSAAAEADLQQARSRFPADRLLLGLLYARSGMVAEADAALREYAAAHPDWRAAPSLLDALHRAADE